MKKPELHFLIPRLGIVDRGAEVFVYELGKYLTDNFEVVVWKRRSAEKSPMALDLQKKGVRIREIGSFTEENFPARLFYRFRFLRPTLDKFHLNPNQIEMLTFTLACLPSMLREKTQLMFPVNGIWGAIGCRFLRFFKGIPFVYATQGGKEPLILKQKPNMVFALTPEVFTWIKKNFPKIKVVLVPNGVDTEKFSPKVRPAKPDLERPIFLCVAALIPGKKIDLAIKAVSRFKKGSLLVVGDGPLKNRLEDLGKRLLGKKRFLIQKFPHGRMPHVYTAADVFTLPAIDEPFGIVYLEAMASGLPVVAPNDESRRYIVGKAGILCDVENEDKYTYALEKALRLDFGDLPRKQAEKFSWEKIGGLYKKELKKLLKLK